MSAPCSHSLAFFAGLLRCCPMCGARPDFDNAQGMSARQGENSRSEVEAEGRQPGPAQQDAPEQDPPLTTTRGDVT